MTPALVYRTQFAFYHAVAAELRLHSPEYDYGCWWRAAGEKTMHRVAWVENTGELVAIADRPGHPVELLGRLPRATGDQPPNATVDVVLGGWQLVCGLDGSLDWIRGRMLQYVALDAAIFGGKDAPDDLDAKSVDAYERCERALCDRREAAPASAADVVAIADRRRS